MEKTQQQAEVEFNRIINALNAAVGEKGKGVRNFLPVRKGTGISTSWLSAFADQRIEDAGFKRLYVLAAWLKEHGYMDGNTPALRVQPINTDSRSGYEVRA